MSAWHRHEHHIPSGLGIYYASSLYEVVETWDTLTIVRVAPHSPPKQTPPPPVYGRRRHDDRVPRYDDPAEDRLGAFMMKRLGMTRERRIATRGHP